VLPVLWLLLAVPRPTAPDSNLFMFRGGPQHTGEYPAARGSYAGIAWRLQTGGAVRSSPVVREGTVYVGSSDGRVYAVDAARGTVRWRYDAGSAVSASPAVADGLVLVTAWDGSVHAIVRSTGKRAWRVPTGPDARLAWGYESGDNWTSSPTVVGTTVLVGSGDGGLYALDLATGRRLWRAATGGRIRSSPAVAGDQVIVGSFDGNIYALDRASGRERWHFATEGTRFASDTFGYDRKSVQSSPAIAGNMVLAGARDGFLYALDLATGTERWRVDHQKSWVNCSAAVTDGTVYIGTSDGQFLQALDLATGTQRWRADTIGLVWGSPIVAGSVVYAPTTRGPLLAFDRASGRELWRVRFAAGSFSSPAIAGDRLFIGGEDGALYALDLTAPAPLRRMVFWDGRLDRISLFADGVRLRDYLSARGYQVVDAGGLAAALDPSRAPGSVVVFAQDLLPSEVLGANPAAGPFRRYLEAGGRVVWPGVPPAVWPRDTAEENLSLRAIDRNAGRTLLDVGFEGGNFDQRPSIVTAAGRTWGLSGSWLANWAADPATVTEVLALDDQRHATAWVRRYGTAGGRFVRVPLPSLGEGSLPAYSEIQRVAEREGK
jgi:eukaryotic-like serine/threonine-protein kinase